jgi:hypothetical protein
MKPILFIQKSSCRIGLSTSEKVEQDSTSPNPLPIISNKVNYHKWFEEHEEQVHSIMSYIIDYLQYYGFGYSVGLSTVEGLSKYLYNTSSCAQKSFYQNLMR